MSQPVRFYTGLPKVPNEANAELQRPISAGELQIALQSMKCGKAPGMDGFHVEFYRVFCVPLLKFKEGSDKDVLYQECYMLCLLNLC